MPQVPDYRDYLDRHLDFLTEQKFLEECPECGGKKNEVEDVCKECREEIERKEQ